MNILVLDIPTVDGGGLTILLQFYKKALDDAENDWFFFVGKPSEELIETKKVHIIHFPSAKKNWLNRFFFDFFSLPRLVKKYSIDKTISLQGTYVRRFKGHQTLYIQQALFFSDYPTNIFLEPRIWFYKHVLSNIRKRDMRKADCIIVQTNSTKQLCMKKYHVLEDRFVIEEPIFSLPFLNNDYARPSQISFFYPTSSYLFKNVDTIIEATKKIISQGVTNFIIFLTISESENAVSKKWFKKCQKYSLPIEFIGYQKSDDMARLYSTSVLLFPSYTESFGLPLLEAKKFGAPIISIDKGYARDVLKDYKDVNYFDVGDIETLSRLMLYHIQKG